MSEIERHTWCWYCQEPDSTEHYVEEYDSRPFWSVYRCKKCSAKKVIGLMRGSPIEGKIEYVKPRKSCA